MDMSETCIGMNDVSLFFATFVHAGGKKIACSFAQKPLS